MKKAALAIGAALLFVFGFWHIALPKHLIAERLENALHSQDIYLMAEGLRKGIFYTVSADQIRLRRRDSEIPLAAVGRMRGRLDFTSLLALKPEIAFAGTLNGGVLTGSVELSGGPGLRIQGDGVQIAGFGLLEQYGFKGSGILSFRFLERAGKGEGIFTVTDMRLENTAWGGVPLPLGLFNNAKGAVVVDRGDATVRSFGMEGDGIYARLKGNVRGDSIGMVLEIMTDATFSADPVYRAMLRQYEVSPGYYSLPVKGSASRLFGARPE